MIQKKLRELLKKITGPKYDIQVPFVRDFASERQLVREILDTFDYDQVIAIAKNVQDLSSIPGYTDRTEMRASIESTIWSVLDNLAEGKFVEYTVETGSILYTSRISGQFDVEVWHKQVADGSCGYGAIVKFAPVECESIKIKEDECI